MHVAKQTKKTVHLALVQKDKTEIFCIYT